MDYPGNLAWRAKEEVRTDAVVAKNFFPVVMNGGGPMFTVHNGYGKFRNTCVGNCVRTLGGRRFEETYGTQHY